MAEKYRPVIDRAAASHPDFGPTEAQTDTLASWERHLAARRAKAPPREPGNLDRMIAAHRGPRKVPTW